MYKLALALGLLLLVPSGADAAKKRKHPQSEDTGHPQVRAQRDREARAEKKARQERESSEAELARAQIEELRSGRTTRTSLAGDSSDDRDFPTQQLDDSEKPPTVARR